MFEHVTIRVSDRKASRRFYETAFGRPLDHNGTYEEWADFRFTSDGGPVTRGLHVGFVAQSRAEVDEFWRRGVDAGYQSDGEPGPRPQYSPDYYGGFLLDPDGNSIEKVNHGESRPGIVDHLWIGVDDLDAHLRFWQTVAPVLGFRIKPAEENRFHVAASTGSFALVADGRRPTENLHLAFPAPDDATVAEFHRRAAGYVGAFVLDPGGNTVEVVNHNR